MRQVEPDPFCVCEHRESEHLANIEYHELGRPRLRYITGACAVDRRLGAPECGCTRFEAVREQAR